MEHYTDTRAGVSLPYDPDSGRYGYCTGHVEGTLGALVYVHPADCPLHPNPGLCESCGQHRAATEWAGTGELICWQCCQQRQDTYHGRQGQ